MLSYGRPVARSRMFLYLYLETLDEASGSRIPMVNSWWTEYSDWIESAMGYVRGYGPTVLLDLAA